MTTVYTFIITASGPNPQPDDFEARFYEAGCDDATIAFQGGRIVLDFDRGAMSLGHAVMSAIEDVHRAGAIVEGISAGIDRKEPRL